MTMFSESFDGYASGSGTDSQTGISSGGWVWAGNNYGAVDIPGRFGGLARQCYSDTSNSGFFSRFWKNLGFQSPEFSMSVALRGNGQQSGNTYFGVGDGTNPQINVRFWDDNSIRIYRGGGAGGDATGGVLLWASAPGSYPLNIWHTIRLKGLIDPVAGTLDMMVDNDLVCQLTGINTRSTANSWVNSAHMNARGSTIHIDDVVIIDENSAFLPECRIQQLLPNADGGTLQLVPSTGATHFGVVDEAQVATADYLQGTLDGEHDLLGVQDLASVPGSILGLKIIGWAKKTDAASRAWKLGIKSGATVDDGAQQSLTTDLKYLERLFETDPNTALAWTQAGVNAVELKPTVVVPV